MKRVKSNLAELNAKLEPRNTRAIAPYIGSNVPMMFECLEPTCKHTWKRTAAEELFLGRGCKMCHGTQALWKAAKPVPLPESEQPSIEVTKEFIELTNSRRLVKTTSTGNLQRASAAIEHKCQHTLCNHEWTVPVTSYNTFEQRQACPKCLELIHNHKNPSKPLTTRQRINTMSKMPKHIKDVTRLTIYAVDSLYKHVATTTNSNKYLILSFGTHDNFTNNRINHKLTKAGLYYSQLYELGLVMDNDGAETLRKMILTEFTASTKLIYPVDKLRNELTDTEKSAIDLRLAPTGVKSQDKKHKVIILPYTSYNQLKNIIESYLQEEI